jgi:hypothetical protein
MFLFGYLTRETLYDYLLKAAKESMGLEPVKEKAAVAAGKISALLNL